MRLRFSAFFVLVCAVAAYSFAAAVPVKVKKVEQGWQLTRAGKPCYVNGAAGHGHLDLLKKLGGNSVRTWSVHEFETTSLLKEANALGITIAAGLAMEPPRHGFNYAHAVAVKAQYDRASAAVEKYKNEPAILVWGIGNEMEADGTDPAIWKAVNDIAREIHRRDPNHPTMTVIAGAGQDNIKLINFMKYCPDVDILGINSYGGMATLLEDVNATKLDRPYMVTEFGPLGWWERAKTSWGAPLEQTSTEKAATYRQSYEHSIRDAGRKCLGSYAFLWGWKQERTHTWFNMLLPDLNTLDAVDKTAAADVISYEWTGRWPANRAPDISPIRTASAEKEVAPG
ncbi:MAG TPA: glycoside hydrolase family 2 TIM barrel-domain containing protein, partial [Terriglobales bacterium]|nr:glycoside hydrolase family 2 TIM barrel-domain containing protein [Terriglobales bacterium]